ncbi:MAG: hypothetical protein ABSH50_04620 [Bryobacteraceae bacterium]|jgi:hypothetical protein
MKRWLPVTVLFVGIAAHAADPQESWEVAVKAKGGRERLHSVRSLAVYMKPAAVNLMGPPTTWLCVFPDRYFEYDGRGSGEYEYRALNGGGMAGNPRAIVVDGTASRVAMDANGTPRVTFAITARERDRLTLNQVIYLLESAWLHPRVLAAKGRTLTVEAGGDTFRITLDTAGLPERVTAMEMQGRKSKDRYDYRLERYRELQGILLPGRVTWSSGLRQWTWDVDYDVDAGFNPQFFARMPDLANGPEPWRQR